MKTSPPHFIGLRRFVLPWRLLTAATALTLLWQGTPPARAEIPEPPTLFYGQIINRTSGQVYLLTNGTLMWKILPLSGGSPIVLISKLEPIADSTLSYRLKVPHEALAPGTTVSVGKVPLTQAGENYQHVEILVEGFPAKVLGDNTGTFHLEQADRAKACRLDLELFNPLADSDGDGLPDWWEDRFGLDKYFAGDAGLDPDGDESSNLHEFLAGSDPNTSNTSPRLATHHIEAPEGGTLGLQLRTLDSDTQPSDLRYTLLGAPAGCTLHLRNASPSGAGEAPADRSLAVNDVFTQADVNAGRVILRHEGPLLATASMVLAVSDENPLHPASTGTVTIAFSAVGDGQPSLWLDAATAVGQDWPDRSANHLDATPVSGNPSQPNIDAPGGRQSLYVDSSCWGLAVSDEIASFPAGERTLFAVFKGEGAGRQQVVGTTRFELGLTATADPLRPGQLRYATESAALYSPRPVHGQWLLATVWDLGPQAYMEVNGVWLAGPNPYQENTALANKSAVAGKVLGHFNSTSQAWEYQPVELLTGQVGEILCFNRALKAADRRRINHQLLSKWFGYVIWDASQEASPVKLTVPSSGLTQSEYTDYLADHGPDRSNIMLGGAGPDELRGGMETDILIGGPGNDRLAGGGGRDIFVIRAGDANDTVLDFKAAEGDALDLSDLLAGVSRNLADYVQLSTAGTNSWLRINTTGAGTGFTNAEIVLLNNVLRQSDLESLWAHGNVVARGVGVQGPAWINIAATGAHASEEGPTPAEFTITRSGSAEAALTINLSVGGSAINGVDFSYIGNTATFAPGQSNLKVVVEPYADNVIELPEVVELMVLAGTGYNAGTTSRAQITIADLPERISIEAIEAFASRSTATPGYLLVSRSGVLSRSTTVRLAVSGTAVNGADFHYVSGFLMLSPSQASALVPIIPITNQPAISGAKTVDVRILPDPNSLYLPGGSSTGRVWLVEETLNLGSWRARSLPGSTTDLVLLAGQDPDHDGLVNLVEYSLGSDPKQTDGAETRALMPRARLRDGHLVVEFKKRVAAKDIQYVVEVSSDLIDWQTGPAHIEEITLPELLTQPDTACFRDRTPCTTATHRYIRVRVKLQL